MESTESSTLRPLTVGQILDRSMRLYRQRFLTFTGIIAVMLVPLTILQIILTWVSIPNSFAAMEQMQDAVTAEDPMALFASQMALYGFGRNSLISVLSFVLINGFATAAFAYAIAGSYLGKPVDILSAYGKLSGIFLRLIGVLIVWAILYVGIIVFTIIPCVGWLIGPGMIVFFFYIILPLVPVIVVLEEQGGFGAIRRAWDLIRRRFWWVLGFMVVLWVFSYILLFGPRALLSWLLVMGLDTVLPNADQATIYGIQTGVTQVASMVAQLLYLPIQLTALVLMYFDLRVRTEGLDLAMMATNEKDTVADETPPVMLPPAPVPASGSVLTVTEMAYFIGITVGIIALVVLFYFIILLIVVAIMIPTLGLTP